MSNVHTPAKQSAKSGLAHRLFRRKKGHHAHSQHGHPHTPEHKVKGVKKERRPSFFNFRISDQILFAKRLGMILRSGMPIMEGLHMLNGQAQGRSSRYVYSSLIAHVGSGQSLSSGLHKFEKVFGEFCINIVKVGETSGTLHENLDYLAEELKKKQALRKKVIGALVYPAVIVFATVGIAGMLTIYIFPKITPIFQSFKSTLPLSTRALISISNFLLKDGWWFLLAIIGAVIAFFLLARIRRVKLVLHKILLRLPLFGKLAKYYNLANIARTLGLLLKSEVRILEAFAIVADSTRNRAYREILQKVAVEVTKGHKISTEIKKYPTLFPSLFTQMVSVGEQTGNLSGSLAYLSDMYEEEISDLTKNLTTMLEPILMIVMGVIVGFIAISIITPIYGITQNVTPYR